MSELVRARWVGPSGYQLADKTNLVPGETEAEIPEFEATESDNWEPISLVRVEATPSATVQPGQTNYVREAEE